MYESWKPPPVLGDGRYVVGEEIGRGGVGVVHAVRDTRADAELAAKILFPRFHRSRGRERFGNEARVLVGLRHPHVVAVYDLGDEEDTSWFVMERLHGGSLAERLREEGALPLPEVVRIASELLEALAAAHAAGLVHRDVKPGNVLLADDGTVKLGDFGLVKLTESNLTVTGSRLGTVFFTAPEQRVDPREVTARSDLFSVAATIAAMATGRRPPNLTLLDVEPELLDPLPEPLRPIVRRGGAYEPGDRYANAEEMHAALAALGV